MSAITVTVLQKDLHWENQAANLAMFDAAIAALPAAQQVIILPEMFTTGFSMNASLAEPMDGATVNWMKQTATAKKAIIAGSVIIAENGHYYNRFLWVQPDGVIGQYDKRHLFAYAGEHNTYTSGNKRLLTQVNGIKFNCNVCYDLRFPVWARQQAETYDVLVYVANWPVRRAYAWKALLVARAIENQCYVIGVNRVGTDGNGHQYSGDTMIVDPLGEIVFHKANEEVSFSYVIDKEKIETIRTQLPFLKDADRFELLG